MKDEPLFPYLFEIARRPESEGMILSGGFGMRVKLAHLQQSKATMLSAISPQPRVTADLDLFLRVQFWVEIERATAINAMLIKDLDYEAIIPSWHFRKPFHGHALKYVKLDFQARPPLPDERVKVKKAGGGGGRITKQRQVGREMGTGLSGLETVEAFAVDHRPIQIPLVLEGETAVCLVPHPYAWLNLKVAAAYDWLREKRGEILSKAVEDGEDSRRLKHVYDVLVLVAMLTEDELAECKGTRQRIRISSDSDSEQDQCRKLV